MVLEIVRSDLFITSISFADDLQYQNLFLLSAAPQRSLSSLRGQTLRVHSLLEQPLTL